MGHNGWGPNAEYQALKAFPFQADQIILSYYINVIISFHDHISETSFTGDCFVSLKAAGPKIILNSISNDSETRQYGLITSRNSSFLSIIAKVNNSRFPSSFSPISAM